VASPGFGVRGHDDVGTEGASIEAPSGVGMVWGGVSAVQPTMGSRGASSAESGVKPRPSAAIAFSAYFRPRNASGSKKNTVKKYCET